MASGYLQGSPSLLCCTGLLTVAVATVISITHYVYARRRYPPGPKAWPIIGNVFNMPKTYQWLVFQDWSRIFGEYFLYSFIYELFSIYIGSDILHLKIFGTHMFILNSATVARELLDKRSAIYSDRYMSSVPFLLHSRV